MLIDVKIKYELFILANTIFLFYNVLGDIFFGFYADRIKYKLGRRIPYIRYGAPFFSLTFFFFKRQALYMAPPILLIVQMKQKNPL